MIKKHGWKVNKLNVAIKWTGLFLGKDGKEGWGRGILERKSRWAFKHIKKQKDLICLFSMKQHSITNTNPPFNPPHTHPWNKQLSKSFSLSPSFHFRCKGIGPSGTRIKKPVIPAPRWTIWRGCRKDFELWGMEGFQDQVFVAQGFEIYSKHDENFAIASIWRKTLTYARCRKNPIPV